MGIDCSNCKCTNRDDEKILIIDNAEKIQNSKIDSRKDRLEQIERSQSSQKLVINDILSKNPKLSMKLVRLQALIRMYRHRKTYKALLKKFRVYSYIIYS